MKSGEEAVYLLIDRMNEVGIDYMIVGALSSNAYGIARATKDADFVIQTTEEKRHVLLRSLPPDFVIDDQVTFETVTGHRRQLLKLPKIPYVIELFDLSNERFDRERFSRRKATVLAGRPAWLPSPEDVVIQKLRWAGLGKRAQDLIDASNVIQVSGEFLDWTYIEAWCAELGVTAKLAEARAAAND